MLAVRHVFLAILCCVGGGSVFGGEVDALSLLEWRCVRCHGGEKTKGGLDLTTREGLMRGGESGAVILEGKPESSLLVRSIRHESDSNMPYKEKKLPDSAIKTISDWVRDGAMYSRRLKAVDGDAAETATQESHWAFEPITRPAPPQSPEANPIDRFIGAKLAEAHLRFSGQATAEQLVRRTTFDLIGLPPTIADIEAFVKNPSIERLVERLLASPQYGERWGRHWLDLARFAESDGFEHDAVRPHSWRYRDYVVKAFNDDKPYDQFIREQLAGDELWPDRPEAVVATAFNLLGPDMVDSSDQAQRRHNTLNDMTDTAALTFLGLTMGCARCHDHKFEPLSQKDYYALQAFFAPAKFESSKEVPTPDQRATHDIAMRQYQNQAPILELAELESGPRKRIMERKVSTLSTEAQMAHNTPPEKRNAEQANLVLEIRDRVAITEQDLAAEFNGDQKTRRGELLEAIKKLPKPAPLPMTLALANQDLPPKARVLHRGEYTAPGDEILATIPAALRRIKSPALHEKKPRASLADWIAAPENPLTARVMVNRIWQHYFGRGLVASPSNFGTQGQKPTHPELLDWLAAEFVASGWSVKHMHRLILSSRTYQQNSAGAHGLDIDPQNKLLWRMNRLRLEGEAIRDSMLAISGELRLEMGGPGVFPPIPKELFQGAAGWPSNARDSKQDRRSIYIFARRNLRFPFLEVFDMPDNNLSCPVRESTATAPQSLTLLNSSEVTRASKLTAARVKSVEDAYRAILGRPPTRAESTIAREFLKASPMSELCRALYNVNDFVYVN